MDTLDTFPDSQSPPSLAEAPGLLAALARDILQAQPPYDNLFTVELALRALRAVLEEDLQARVLAEGDFEGVREVSDALQQLGGHLNWLELHGQAPLDEVHVQLRESVLFAEHAARFLA